MKAFFYPGPADQGRSELRDVSEPTVREPDDVIVEVEVAGVCGTDLHIVSVPQLHPAADGIVLGHEFVGRVVATGAAVQGLAPGDRVIAGPNVWCGQCASCRRGLRNLCDRNQTLGITRDGGFARYARAPARALYHVPDGLSPEEAVFAEPLSCILNGFARIGPSYGDRVAVLGAGPIGLYFIRLFRHFGATMILATEPTPQRREYALRSGATQVIDPFAGGVAVVEQLRDWTGGGADVVVDTTGSLLRDALAATRKGGTVLVFGMDTTHTANIRPYDIVREEKKIIGCFANNDMIPRCLELIPHLGLSELISHRLPLEGIETALQAFGRGEAIKALLLPAQRAAN